MKPNNLNLDHSWKDILSEEMAKDYFRQIGNQIEIEENAGYEIYPHKSMIFHAFNRTPFDQVKVVLIGQDPYHNPGQAMGLSFAVPQDVKRPPSLLNIYKELKRDLGYAIPTHGDISAWADEGVLMLNAMLTVRAKEPGSHRKIGWQQFTDAVISKISEEKDNIVFLLWGNFAKSKVTLIDADKHLILEAAHPSPLARNAFYGNSHFSLTNKYLLENQIKTVNWKIE